MPLPAAETPQWLVNLSVVAAGVVTAVTAFFIKRSEGRKPEPPIGAQIVPVGGALLDGRSLDRLSDAIAHQERATRDLERAVIDNTREVERASENMGDVRRAVTERNRQVAAEDARQLAAIDAAVARAKQGG